MCIQLLNSGYQKKRSRPSLICAHCLAAFLNVSHNGVPKRPPNILSQSTMILFVFWGVGLQGKCTFTEYLEWSWVLLHAANQDVSSTWEFLSICIYMYIGKVENIKKSRISILFYKRCGTESNSKTNEALNLFCGTLALKLYA